LRNHPIARRGPAGASAKASWHTVAAVDGMGATLHALAPDTY